MTDQTKKSDLAGADAGELFDPDPAADPSRQDRESETFTVRILNRDGEVIDTITGPILRWPDQEPDDLPDEGPQKGGS